MSRRGFLAESWPVPVDLIGDKIQSRTSNKPQCYYDCNRPNFPSMPYQMRSLSEISTEQSVQPIQVGKTAEGKLQNSRERKATPTREKDRGMIDWKNFVLEMSRWEKSLGSVSAGRLFKNFALSGRHECPPHDRTAITSLFWGRHSCLPVFPQTARLTIFLIKSQKHARLLSRIPLRLIMDAVLIRNFKKRTIE